MNKKALIERDFFDNWCFFESLYEQCYAYHMFCRSFSGYRHDLG